jgi:hypothetical protein
LNDSQSQKSSSITLKRNTNMNVTKSVLNPNLQVFVEEIVQHVKDGWEIDPQMPPTMLGYWYETIMVRDESIVDPVKVSRAEILAKARAAKKAKAEETPEGEAPPAEEEAEDE